MPNKIMSRCCGNPGARRFVGRPASQYHSTALHVFRVPVDGLLLLAVQVGSLAEGRL